MQTRLIFLFFSLFVTSRVFSQHTYTFRTDSSVQTLSHSYCDRVKIIDMRADKEDLGHLRTGAFNRYASIVTEQPLADLLTNYYQQHVKYSTTGHKELLVMLYGFKMEDRPNGDELGTFYFDADFYQGDGTQYQMLAHENAIYEMRSGWDVSGMLVRSVREKVQGLLAQMSALKVISTKTLTLEEVKTQRQVDKLPFPIYNTDSFKRGIYLTLDQFLNHSPSDTAFEVVTTYNTDTKVYSFYYLKANGKKGKKINPKDVFAIYDNNQWFAAANGNIISPMKYENGDFISKLYLPGIANKSNVVMAGALFGIAGALIADATTSNKGMGLYKVQFDPKLKTFVPVKRIK